MAQQRNASRTRAKDVKPGIDNVDYPTGDISTPQVTVTRTANKAQDLEDFKVAHPRTDLFPDALLVSQDTSIGDTNSQEVNEVFKTLPGTPLTSVLQDQVTGLTTTRVETDIDSADVAEQTIIPGQTIDFQTSGNKNWSKQIQENFDLAQMASYFRAYPTHASLNLPPILLALSVLWDVSAGNGTYSETGTGFAYVVSSGSLTLPSSANAQGSVGVMPQLLPQWGAYFTEDLPVVDLCFYLPNPVTEAEIFTRASAIATIMSGVATVVNPWPLFRPKRHTFALIGQKCSVSARATARVSVSVDSSGDVSETILTGSGGDADVSTSARGDTLPDCIHGDITIGGGITLSGGVTIPATATVTGSGGFPSASGSASRSGSASGEVGSLDLVADVLPATTVSAYPASGIYGLHSSEPHNKDFAKIVVRTFDFSLIA